MRANLQAPCYGVAGGGIIADVRVPGAFSLLWLCVSGRCALRAVMSGVNSAPPRRL